MDGEVSDGGGSVISVIVATVMFAVDYVLWARMVCSGGLVTPARSRGVVEVVMMASVSQGLLWQRRQRTTRWGTRAGREL